jgi:alpha-L-arabinofuranosidase
MPTPALQLFDFENGVQDWTGTSGASVVCAKDGALGTHGCLKCAANGKGFGCRSPEIDDGRFTGFNAIVLYRKEGAGSNIRDRMEVYVTDRAGRRYGATTSWAKTDWKRLVITPVDLRYVDGGTDPGNAAVVLSSIARIEFFMPESVGEGLTEFMVDEISVETLTPPSPGPFDTQIEVGDASGTISSLIYGVNVCIWDEILGFKGHTLSPGTGRPVITSNQEYEEQMIAKHQNIYWKINHDAGIRLMRWPGGLQANNYWWSDYIGPIEGVGPGTRPGAAPTNPFYLKAGRDLYPMQVRCTIGTDEFLQWCEDIGAEPLLIVNANDAFPKGFCLTLPNGERKTGLVDRNSVNALQWPSNEAWATDPAQCGSFSGDFMTDLAINAADWLEYCNAPADAAATNPGAGKGGIDYRGAQRGRETNVDWAEVRAANGHAAPYNVRYWEFGNENWSSTRPDIFGDAIARIVDYMEERQAEIDAGVVNEETKAAARKKMYILAVDNGGSSHRFTDDQWYGTILERSYGGIKNSERIDAWSKHPYVNLGESSGKVSGYKRPVSGFRIQNDKAVIEVPVRLPSSGDWRFWIYASARTNGSEVVPSLTLTVDPGAPGESVQRYPGLPTEAPAELNVLIPGLRAGDHVVRLQAAGTYSDPFGGISSSKSKTIYLNHVVKAVNTSGGPTGDVVDFLLTVDDGVSKAWQAGSWLNTANYDQPQRYLTDRGIAAAITEWNDHTAYGGNQYKYLTDDVDGNAVSRRGATLRGDRSIEALALVDSFLAFAQHSVKVAAYHALYEDTNQFGMIEGVGIDSYTADTSVSSLTDWEIGRPTDANPDLPRPRPMALIMSMFSRDYRGSRVETTVKNSPGWETDGSPGFVADHMTNARFGIGAVFSSGWESANNGALYPFACGSGTGSFIGTPGSGFMHETIKAGAAMPDANHLNLMVVNHENIERTVTINLKAFRPRPAANVEVFGIDNSGAPLFPQAGTDPEHSRDRGAIRVQLNPPGYAIPGAAPLFRYTLPPRSVVAIKLVRSGADIDPPLPPASVTADGTSAGGSIMRINWTQSPGAVGYNIYRSRSAAGPFTHKVNRALVTDLAFDDPEVLKSDLLYPGSNKPARWNYAVTAVDSVDSDLANESVFSPIIHGAAFGKKTTSDG